MSIIALHEVVGQKFRLGRVLGQTALTHARLETCSQGVEARSEQDLRRSILSQK